MSADILVAGVGNLFRGDDGFGPEVARRLAAEALPDGVASVDFGIRGLHLSFALLEAPRLLIVADLVARGVAPGTVTVLEPDADGLVPGTADAHGMDLPSVFANVVAMGGSLPRTRIVGCEPASLDEGIGLSDSVAAAVAPAIAAIRAIIASERQDAAAQVRGRREQAWHSNSRST